MGAGRFGDVCQWRRRQPNVNGVPRYFACGKSARYLRKKDGEVATLLVHEPQTGLLVGPCCLLPHGETRSAYVHFMGQFPDWPKGYETLPDEKPSFEDRRRFRWALTDLAPQRGGLRRMDGSADRDIDLPVLPSVRRVS